MISRSASYAIRALTYMAERPDQWALNREIAAELSLPPQFLTKILRALAEAGILSSQRGKSGGFRLARPAGEVTLLEVVDPLDHLSDHRPCLLGLSVCSDETPCPVHAEWTDSQDTMLRILRMKTIGDIAAAARPGGFPRTAVSSAVPGTTGDRPERV